MIAWYFNKETPAKLIGGAFFNKMSTSGVAEMSSSSDETPSWKINFYQQVIDRNTRESQYFKIILETCNSKLVVKINLS